MLKVKKNAALRALALTLAVLMIGCGGAGAGGNAGAAGKAETVETKESQKETPEETSKGTAEGTSKDEESTAGGFGEGAASGMKKGLFPGTRKRAEKEQEQEKTEAVRDTASEDNAEDVAAGSGEKTGKKADKESAERTGKESTNKAEAAATGRTEAATADGTEQAAAGRTEAATADGTEQASAGRTEAATADGTEQAAAGRTGGEDESEGLQTAGESRGLIVIDPGHQQYANMEQEPIGPGASETKISVSGGTSGVASGEPEHQLTLEVSLQLREELEKRGYTVIMVRETNDVDISNSDRAAIANDAGADAFVRIHANGAGDQSVTGAMTICQTPSNPYNGDLYEESRLLSDCILESYTQKTGIDYEYVWETDTMSGINWARVPVTILEMGYMSNSEEDLKMQDPDMQDQMAEGIADGIDRFMEKEEPEQRQGSMPADENLVREEDE